MKTVGIVCEYNPFHNGHLTQFRRIREMWGEDTAIVCLMSGSYVQRGAPAIMDKSIRAQAAILCGADLVLELPPEISLSSAEGFAAGGVAIASRCCDALCFGTESMDREALLQTAQALCAPEFPPLLRQALTSGCSFPVARGRALTQMGISWDVSSPNNILGIEYTKAMLQQGSAMEPMPIFRAGSYHDTALCTDAPSATAVRQQMGSGGSWEDAVPPQAAALFQNATLHTLEAGERAILARLRTMTGAEFEALPYGSEGLWRKLMKAAGRYATLSEIVDAVKSKRYTRTRIDRMILCAFLGLTQAQMGVVPPTVRVLGFSAQGRQILRAHPEFRNAGEAVSPEELRLGSLYGLFSTQTPEAPDAEAKRRIFYSGM